MAGYGSYAPKGKVSSLVYKTLTRKKPRGRRTVADMISDRDGVYVTDKQVSNSLTYLKLSGFVQNTKPGMAGSAAGENWVRV